MILSSISRLTVTLAAALLTVLCFTAPSTSGAVKATVTLSDGRLFSGDYLGGNADTLRIRRNGDVFNIPVNTVQLITFGKAAQQLPEVHLELHKPPAQRDSAQAAVPAETVLKVMLGQPLSTATSKSGATFTAILSQNVTSGETVLIRKGMAAYGRVASVHPGGELSGEPRLSLVLDSLHLPTGTCPLKTRVWIEPGTTAGGAVSSPYLTPDNQLALPPGTELEFVLVQPVPIPKQ